MAESGIITVSPCPSNIAIDQPEHATRMEGAGHGDAVCQILVFWNGFWAYYACGETIQPLWNKWAMRHIINPESNFVVRHFTFGFHASRYVCFIHAGGLGCALCRCLKCTIVVGIHRTPSPNDSAAAFEKNFSTVATWCPFGLNLRSMDPWRLWHATRMFADFPVESRKCGVGRRSFGWSGEWSFVDGILMKAGGLMYQMGKRREGGGSASWKGVRRSFHFGCECASASVPVQVCQCGCASARVRWGNPKSCQVWRS